MTLPRAVLPGRCYLITRRCAQREFLLKPDKEVNNAFIYCLAIAAQRCEVDIVVTCAMSNHHHTVIYDREGRYPEFLEHFHKLLARCLNARYGRRENFWSSAQVSVVHLVGGADVLDKIAYTILNPVAAHLVERTHQWPGVLGYRALLSGEPLRATRPTFFFKQEDSKLPATVELPMSLPPVLTLGAGGEKARARIRELVVEEEEALIERRRRKGIRVMGVAAILKASRFCRGKREEELGELSPGIAAKDSDDRIQALIARKEFLAAYRAARRALVGRKRNGTRRAQVLFPEGTWWLQRHAAVPVAS